MEATAPQSKTLTRDYSSLEYAHGFGNHVATEALKDALPKNQNSPQKCPYDLIAEQLSGTAFTVPRSVNQRSWLYRIKPSVCHQPFKKSDPKSYHSVISNFISDSPLIDAIPNQIRWKPAPLPKEPTNFIQGFITVAGSGDPSIKQGIAIHVYAANTSMDRQSFYNSDGDYLIVPQQGTLYITTELGKLTVKTRQIAVIQRGIQFTVEVEGPVRGYVCEVFKGHFRIPDLGPIGSNGLANPRDFEIPTAYYENNEDTYKIVNQFCGQFYETTLPHSPYNVVAWHGNYAPYKYNLDHFNTMNTVSFDHPDPSIFTVLTCPTDEPGVAVCDFAIFPPRWMVAENTFRPPWYHRNCMSEYMGNICGKYDAQEQGFLPGGGSLHSCMSAHGPDTEAFEQWTKEELKPTQYPYENLAFMFQSSYLFQTTTFSLDHELQTDKDYMQCWQNLNQHKLGEQ